MKNKMITSEKAYDMLPYVVDIYDKLDLDGYRKGLTEENKEKGKDELSMTEIGVQAFKHMLKNSGKVKEEVFEIVAIADDLTAQEAKDQSIVTTLATFKEIFSDKDLVDFFKQAMA